MLEAFGALPAHPTGVDVSWIKGLAIVQMPDYVRQCARQAHAYAATYMEIHRDDRRYPHRYYVNATVAQEAGNAALAAGLLMLCGFTGDLAADAAHLRELLLRDAEKYDLALYNLSRYSATLAPTKHFRQVAEEGQRLGLLRRASRHVNHWGRPTRQEALLPCSASTSQRGAQREGPEQAAHGHGARGHHARLP